MVVDELIRPSVQEQQSCSIAGNNGLHSDKGGIERKVEVGELHQYAGARGVCVNEAC